MIIALTGQMGSGKSTALDIIKSRKEAMYVKFAQPLYDLQTTIYNELGLDLNSVKGKDRRLLQVLGTDWGRDKDPNIWVNAWQKKVLNLGGLGYDVITDDCRFINEAEKIKEMGGIIIKIQGPQRGEFITGTSHASEADITKINADYTIINDGTLSELETKIDKVLEEVSIWK
jgi:hypothetical protein